MRQNNSALFSATVTVTSFILTVLVIWIHAVDPALGGGISPDGPGGMLAAVQGFLGTGLGQIAVPGFFCMSGYLFFRNCGTDSLPGREFYLGKWKKRVRTLVIPYLLWNLIYYCIYLAAGRAQLNLPVVLEAVLNYKFNPVFWYLRELILLTVLTPLIFLLLKEKRFYIWVLAAVFLAAVYYAKLPFHLVNEDAAFYYMTGAALALHAGKWEGDPRRLKRLLATCLGLFLICESIYRDANPTMIMYGIIGGRISGPLALYAAVGLRLSSGKSMLMKKSGASAEGEGPEIPNYMRFNFFIYAVHYLEIRFFQTVVSLLFGGSVPEAAGLVLYLLMPALCIGAAVPVGTFLKQKLPRLWSVLTGGRN